MSVNKTITKSDEVSNEDIETIKTWLKSQPHLPEIMDDAKIRNFIIRSKRSIERTKQKIDMYYTIRSLIPEIYDDINPKLPHNQACMDSVYCITYPTLVQDMYTLCILKPKEPNKFLPRESMMFALNSMELRLSSEYTFGEIYIIDMKNMTLNDVMKLTPSLAMKSATIYEKVFSFRIKTVYVINAPSYVSTFMGVLKTAVKAKIFNRIQICHDEEILKQVFTKDELPRDYGGNGPSLEELTELAKEKLAANQDRFDKLDKMRVDESLRPQKLNNDDLLGFYGNFKKLSVD